MVMFLTSTLSAAIMLGGHGGGGYLLHHLTRLSPEMISDLARHRCDDEALAGCCDQDPLTNMVSASQICIDCAIIFVAQTQPRSSRHGEMFDLEKAPNSSTAGIFAAQDTNFTPLYLWLILRRLRTFINS